MSKIQKIMLEASGVQLTIEKNAQNMVFISVGQNLINQAVELDDILLNYYEAQDELDIDCYSMLVDSINYKLSQDNLKKISAFLGRHIEQAI
ncbi:hypothetical protein [Vibrio sonorensis]|uniref:hypothetical protein n=1 Tax=Vibrio sonorensis TaxID=1004316 RepID=UPI0008D9BA6D|nr:hypothetical protein [Vibrio sonorensis]